MDGRHGGAGVTVAAMVYLAGIVPCFLVARAFLIRDDARRKAADPHVYEVNVLERGFLALFIGALWPFALAVCAVIGLLWLLGKEWA